MKKIAKTSELLNVYTIVANAKYGQMDDKDKIAAWKIARKLKPVVAKYEEDLKDAVESLKPEGDFDEKLKKAQEYDRLKEECQPTIDVMTTAEFDDFKKVLDGYNALIRKADEELLAVDVELEFAGLSEDAFTKMINSNDWTIGQVTLVGDFICE